MKMNNKVLVKIIIPELNLSYDVFIPVNEYIWKVKKLLVKSISEMSNIHLDIDGNFTLINKDTGLSYDENNILIRTDIRNATELILLSY